MADQSVDKLKQLEDFEYICQEIEKGLALRNVCSAFMSTRTFYEILESDEMLQKRYARACEIRAEAIFEDIIEIADESNADISIGEGMIPIINGEAVQRSRLRVDARKWVLSKLHPKKYGDKIDVTTDGEKINGDAIDYSKLSDAALEEISKAKSE